jgi:xylono-1,5-lactonase
LGNFSIVSTPFRSSLGEGPGGFPTAMSCFGSISSERLWRDQRPHVQPDGTVLYHNDSARRVVYAFDLSAGGELTGKREFIRFESEWGYPDGMTTDAEGGIWIAHWDGGRVSRFRPDGTLERSIYLPASNITSCAFAGADLDRLFVTSASLNREGEPEAGALFEVHADVCGLPAPAFAG